MILNLTRFWRAQVCARRAEIIFWNSSTSQLSLEKKIKSIALLDQILAKYEVKARLGGAITIF